MLNRSTPGRRRGPSQPWHRDLRAAVRPVVAVKSLAVLGLLGATGAAVAVPPAGGTATPRAASVSYLPVDRTSAFMTVSRDTERTALAGGPTTTAAGAATDAAVTAPSGVAPELAAVVGISGIEAVAEPVEEPAPEPVPSETQAAAAPEEPSYSTTAYAGMCRALGLGANASKVCSAVRSSFGPMTIGGYRAGDGGDHGSGRAADIMTSNFAQGDAIAAFLQAHARELNVKYIIWRQRYWAPGGSWRFMADRGSPTQNHMDHVHVSVY